MDARRARWLAIVCSGVLLAFGIFQFFFAPASFALVAILLMSALASLGTLVGRVSQATGFAYGAGVMGGFEAVIVLQAHRDPLGVVLGGTILAVCLALIGAGHALKRTMAGTAKEPPPGA